MPPEALIFDSPQASVCGLFFFGHRAALRLGLGDALMGQQALQHLL